MFDRESIDADDDRRSQVDRRSYLKGIAATASLPVAAGITAAASDDYDEIVVSANETYSKSLSNGETWGNVLIDISARGAKFRINATGNDWTIRNVGIRGEWDDTAKDEPIVLSGNGRVENFYWADGTNWTAGGGAVTGMFVPPSHSGEIIIESANFQDFGDNAVYASSPGNPNDHPAPGSGGRVIIRNSYASQCTPAGFRLGTDGSKLENCVMHRNYRNYWAFFQHTELIDCDLSNADGTGDISHRSGLGDVVLGDGAWSASDHASVTPENTYWETEGSHGGASTGNINGSPADREPRTEPSEIEGLPLSAEEAASGSSGSSPSQSPSPSSPENGDDDEDDSSIEDVWEDNESNHVELRGGTPDQIAEYEILGSGDAEAGENADTNSDDPYRDVVTTDGDDFLVEGFLGGHVDDFYITGSITDVETTADLTATVNGHEFDVQELEGVGSWDGDDDAETSDLPHAIVIDGAEAAGTTDYSLSVSEEIVQSEYSGATIDDGDKVEGTTASGTVDDGIDAYRFCGEITDFWLAGEADVTLEYDADN